MILDNKNYTIIGEVYSKKIGAYVPLIDIKLMSDERWVGLTNDPVQKERRENLKKNNDII